MKTSFKEIHFEELDSTSKYLKREYQNLGNLTIVSASFQSAGRGREDRKWISDKGANLLFSLLLKEGDLVKSFPYLSIVSAYAVAKVLIEEKIKDVKVKWPNDVYVGNNKICGILLEGSLPSYLIIGIGINVNQTSFPTDLRHPGTSVSLQLNKSINIDTFKNKIYTTLISEINGVLQGNYSFLDEINKIDYLKGKHILATLNDSTIEQEIDVLGINPDCSLKIKTNGGVKSISCGEINFINR